MTRTKTLPDKDRGRPAPKRPELGIRIVSAALLAAVALAAVIVSPWSLLVLAIFAGAILAWEWGKLVREEGFDTVALIHAIGIAIIAVLVVLKRFDLAFIALVIACCAIWLASQAKHVWWSLAGFLATALPIAAMLWLRGDPAYGVPAVLYVLVVAAVTDTSAYALGRLIGGPKLAPYISPNKTWSGFVAGAVAPALAGYAFALGLGGTSALALALIALGLALACQMGDLAESAVKRHFGVKDMSGLIPGHGGLFDRIDGLLLAAFVAGLIALREAANPGQGLLIW